MLKFHETVNCLSCLHCPVCWWIIIGQRFSKGRSCLGKFICYLTPNAQWNHKFSTFSINFFCEFDQMVFFFFTIMSSSLSLGWLTQGSFRWIWPQHCCKNGGEGDHWNSLQQSSNVSREQSEVHSRQCQMHSAGKF